MITPPPPTQPGMPQFSPYDPLATQFMTGQGMGYMPDAQFMTPSQYGAYRSMPQTASYQQHVTGQPSLFQDWSTTTRGSLGFLPQHMVNMYNPAVDQLRHITMAQRRMNDAQLAATSTVADVGIGMGVGLAVGTINPFLGLAAGMLAPGSSGNISDRIRSQRQIQQMTSSHIVSGSDMSSALGAGFNRSAASSIDQSIRQESAGDLLFKEEDYRKIMQLGIKSGAFDYSNNANQYKQVIKKLRNEFQTFREMMEVMDFGEIAQNMERLIRMGAGSGVRAKTLTSETMYARMTGQSHSDMVNSYGQQGAMLFSQMGLTNYQGSTMNMANAARVEQMKRLGLINESQLARHGGASGMAQTMTETDARSIKEQAGFILPSILNDDMTGIDSERLSAYLRGDVSLEQATNNANRVASSPAQHSKYEANKDENIRKLLDRLGPEGHELMQYVRATQIQQSNQFMPEGVEGLTMAYKLLSPGMTMEQAQMQAQRVSDPQYRAGMQEQLRLQQHKQVVNRQMEEERAGGILPSFHLWRRQLAEDTVGSAFSSVVDWWSRDEDYKEGLDGGIHSSSRYGVTVGFGGYSPEELRKIKTPVKMRPSRLDERVGGTGTQASEEEIQEAAGFRNLGGALRVSDDRYANVRSHRMRQIKELYNVRAEDIDEAFSDFAEGGAEAFADKDGIKQRMRSMLEKTNPEASPDELDRMTESMYQRPGMRSTILATAVRDPEQKEQLQGELDTYQRHQENRAAMRKSGRADDDYYRDMASWYESEEKAVSKYRNLDAAVTFNELGDKKQAAALEQMQEKYGLSAFDIGQGSLNNLQDFGDYSEESNINRAVQEAFKSSGQDLTDDERRQKTEELLKDATFRSTFLGAGMAADSDRLKDARDLMGEKKFQQRSEAYEDIQKYEKGLQDDLGELTKQSLDPFGFGGFDSVTDRKTLEGLVQKTPKALALYHMQTMLEAAKKGMPGMDAAQTKEFLRSQMMESGKSLGLSEEEVMDVIDAGAADSEKIQEIGAKIGLSSEDIAQSRKVAEETGTQRRQAWKLPNEHRTRANFQEFTDSITSTMGKAEIYGLVTREMEAQDVLTEALKNAGMGGVSVDKLLNDQSLMAQVIKSNPNNNQVKGLLNSASRAINAGEQGLSSQHLVHLGGEYLTGKTTKYSSEGAENRQGETSASRDVVRGLQQFSNVHVKLDSTLQSLIDMLRRMERGSDL